MELIDQCVEKCGKKLGAQGFKDTRDVIKEFAQNQGNSELDFDLGDNYLHQRRLDAINAAKQSTEVGIRVIGIETMARFLGYSSFSDFETKNADQIDALMKASNLKIEPGDLNILHNRNPPHKNYWIDRYKLEARVIPAFFGLFPLVLLLGTLAVQSSEINNLMIVLVTIVFALISFQLTGWISTQGKKVQDKVFMGEGKKGFPTSHSMLYAFKGDFDLDQKQKYRDANTAFFGIVFPSLEEEQLDDSAAISKLNQAAYSVKNNVKSNIIFSSNIRYGKIRNSIPASLMGTIWSLVGLVTGIILNDMWLIILLSFSLASYILIYIRLRSYKGLKEAANLYSKYLLEEFLSRV